MLSSWLRPSSLFIPSSLIRGDSSVKELWLYSVLLSKSLMHGGVSRAPHPVAEGGKWSNTFCCSDLLLSVRTQSL